jgi:hypothetical protein
LSHRVFRLLHFDRITPIYLANGYKPHGPPKTGTLDKRAWAILYSVRLDLLDCEVMADAARRFGADETTMNY